jgi:ankyrin repeat protein
MKKLFIAISLLCLTTPSLNAMAFGYSLFSRFISPQPRRETKQQIFGLNSMGWYPDHITLLNGDEPITDELLLELNPEWESVKESSQETKNRTLGWALANVLHGQSAQTLIALAICVGADPNYRTLHEKETALNHSLDESDYELTKYLLSKKADANQEARWGKAPLQFAKTPQIATLLLDYGAEISQKIVETFSDPSYPAHLVEFFVAKGVRLGPNAEGESVLHQVMSYHMHIFDADNGENRIKKLHILLNAGLDSTLQTNSGNTVLHLAAGCTKYTKICQILMNHHINFYFGTFFTLLLCLKKNPHIPYPSKDIRIMLFMQVIIQQVRNLLNKKNNIGKTAYDVWPIEELNPETCSYEKLAKRDQDRSKQAI